MAQRVIPIELTDLPRLRQVDEDYSAASGTEPVVDRASVHYFQRTGHSFLASGAADEVLGFVLAHASWSGGRPVVRVERLAVPPSQPALESSISEALVDAVVKSAYDSGVYDISAIVPRTDAVARAALLDATFAEQDALVFSRVLGSRGSARTDAASTSRETVVGKAAPSGTQGG